MIVIDSSVVIAIMSSERDADELALRIAEEDIGARKISVASYVESGAVLAGRHVDSPPKAIPRLDDFLNETGIDVVPVDADQGRIALEARITFGRGFGSGGKLNFGDCFSYALAKSLGAPLLYVGNDFDKTDITPALKAKR